MVYTLLLVHRNRYRWMVKFLTDICISGFVELEIGPLMAVRNSVGRGGVAGGGGGLKSKFMFG